MSKKSKATKNVADRIMSDYRAMNHKRDHLDNLSQKDLASELATLEELLIECKAAGLSREQKRIRGAMRARRWYRSKTGAFTNAMRKAKRTNANAKRNRKANATNTEVNAEANATNAEANATNAEANV